MSRQIVKPVAHKVVTVALVWAEIKEINSNNIHVPDMAMSGGGAGCP